MKEAAVLSEILDEIFFKKDVKNLFWKYEKMSDFWSWEGL